MCGGVWKPRITRDAKTDKHRYVRLETVTKELDPIIARSLNERLRSVAIRSMDVIEEKLAAEPSAAYAMQALELATVGLGVVGRESR